MHISTRFAVIMLTGTFCAPPAFAQTAAEATLATQAEALGQCFVAKTSGEDRIAVAGWILAAMGSAPKMADVTKVDPNRKIALDKGMAKILTRLIAVDCVDQARPLFAAKSDAAFETAGETLGKIAMKELLTDPAAVQNVSDYVKYLKEDDFKVLK